MGWWRFSICWLWETGKYGCRYDCLQRLINCVDHFAWSCFSKYGVVFYVKLISYDVSAHGTLAWNFLWVVHFTPVMFLHVLWTCGLPWFNRDGRFGWCLPKKVSIGWLLCKRVDNRLATLMYPRYVNKKSETHDSFFCHAFQTLHGSRPYMFFPPQRTPRVSCRPHGAHTSVETFTIQVLIL